MAENYTSSLSVEELMHIAQEKTGLSDWGTEEFLEGLTRLLDACKMEADLSAVGKDWLFKQCIHHLCNRLEIRQTLKKNPEILEVKIERPLFLVTFPRSGSTFLHELICSNSSVREPLFWELWKPTPPPEIEQRKIDPRIELADRLYIMPRNNRKLEGTAAKGVGLGGQGVEECFLLLRNSFTSLDYTFEYNIPSYQKWLEQCDFTLCYQFFKQQLQILQWRTPKKPWVLKCADHILDIPALLKVFPDASIVHLHRHPFKMIPSYCYLQRDVVNIWRNSPIAPDVVGKFTQKRYDLLIELTMKHLNQRENDHQFLDLYYDDLAANPIETIQKIFNYFNYDLDEDGIEQMRNFLKKNKKPRHPYRLDTYSLERQKIEQRYSVYIKKYQLDISKKEKVF